jgi:spore maturation protein SpmA
VGTSRRRRATRRRARLAVALTGGLVGLLALWLAVLLTVWLADELTEWLDELPAPVGREHH